MIDQTAHEVSTQSIEPIRLALIGAGTYARDAHIPSLLNLTDYFDLVAIYSRTQASAEARCAQWQERTGIRPDAYTDLAELLARPDIEAVDILLPISLLPDVVEQALAAGKHVISEKPIAPTVVRAQQLMDVARLHPSRVWMVAENWRYESAHRTAAEIVQNGEIGQPVTCHYALHLPVTPSNKYWQTEWRRNWEIPGGWLVDGGVHHIAALRTIVGEVGAVQAQVRLARPELAPIDTLGAVLHFQTGVVGTYMVTFAVGAFWPPHVHVAGEMGSVRVERGLVEVARDGSLRTIECAKFDGVENELAAFARAVRTGSPHLNTPQEALRDLAVIEAMLQSAESGRLVTVAPAA